MRNVGKTISEEYQLLVEYEDELMKVRNIKEILLKFLLMGLLLLFLHNRCFN